MRQVVLGLMLSRPVVLGVMLYWVSGLAQLPNFGIPQYWLDSKVSQMCTQTYGQTVRIAGLRLNTATRTLTFSSLDILSPGGPEWISCGAGVLSVRSLQARPFKLDFDVRLKSVALHKGLYKRAAHNPLGLLFMHKPLMLQEIALKGTLGPHYTLFEIDDCRSKDVGLRGALRLEKNAFLNQLHISFTTTMLIRSLF